MEQKKLLNVSNAKEFRDWLIKNEKNEKECYLLLKRGQPKNDGNFYYLDAVEVALCFGWIDSTLTKIDGVSVQRFSKRIKGGLWTEQNKERVRRLLKLGLMTESGISILPNMEIKEIEIPKDILSRLKSENALDNFLSFPKLYQRIRLYNLNFYKEKLPKDYEKAIENFIKNTKANKTYGSWSDYGRLLDY